MEKNPKCFLVACLFVDLCVKWVLGCAIYILPVERQCGLFSKPDKWPKQVIPMFKSLHDSAADFGVNDWKFGFDCLHVCLLNLNHCKLHNIPTTSKGSSWNMSSQKHVSSKIVWFDFWSLFGMFCGLQRFLLTHPGPKQPIQFLQYSWIYFEITAEKISFVLSVLWTLFRPWAMTNKSEHDILYQNPSHWSMHQILECDACLVTFKSLMQSLYRATQTYSHSN